MTAVADLTEYRFPDILSLLRIQAEKHGARNGIETEGAPPLTYRAILDRSTAVAKCILAVCSNQDRRRPRIGIVLPNGPEMAVALLGVVAAGAALPFNPSYRKAEFESYFDELCLDALLVRMDDDGPAIAAATSAGIEILRLSPHGGLEGIEPVTKEIPLPAPDDVALVLLTSGSTGRAKSVPLTHRNICSSVDDICRSINLTAEDRCLSMWEQYHVGGLVDLLLVPLASGGTMLCTGGFNANAFFRILDTLKPTWFQAVPTTLNELVFHAARNPVAVERNSMRLIRAVAAALSPALMAEVESLFRVPVIQTFGMTEAGPLISSTRLPPSIRKPGSVGASCGPEIRIVRHDGSTCPVSESGEIVVRGPNVFSGYENDPLANAAQFRNDWFHTGDTGYLDADGDLFLTGRIKQLINRGGEKVNPQEIEDAILTHPAIAEAAVYPLKHRTLGEDVAAAIVLRGPADISEIRAFLSSRLAHFKIPQGISILDGLPRNRIGKVNKIALAASHEEIVKHNLTFTPPRNKLEAYLANLWATELDLYTVGVHDDFAAIGGDSLSSLRILVAVETLFRIKVPERMTITFTTVARMAEQLQSLG